MADGQQAPGPVGVGGAHGTERWCLAVAAPPTGGAGARDAADAAGLQATLRADGVPASVTFTGRPNPACQTYTFNGSLSTPPGKPFGGPLSGLLNGFSFLHNPKSAYNSPYALVIIPSKLPSGAGVQIFTSGTPAAADNLRLTVDLVHTSPQCTGS
jgi:hypothetical protein